MKSTNKRRIYFLSKSSQPHLILGMQIIFVALLLVSGLIFYFVANQDLTESYFTAHLKISNMRQLLLPTLVGINVIGLVTSLILSVFYTHRIAGPVYRLCRILREIGGGNLKHSVKFRKYDELKELDDAASDMIQNLQSKVRKLQILANDLQVELAETQITRAVSTAEKILQSLAEFQMSDDRRS